MRVTFAPLVLATFCGACLPEPPPKAHVDVTIRGAVGASGTPEFQTDDGYVVHFEKRLAILSVAATSQSGSGRYGRGSIRNLDAPPFDATPIRALGNKYIGVYMVSYYGEQQLGPGVTPEDVDLLDGQDTGDHSRSNIASFALTGSITKGGRRWTFDFRGYLPGPVTCGHPSATSDAPVPHLFESDSHHTVDVIVHTESLFLLSAAGVGSALIATPYIAADTNDDGLVSTEEAAKVFSTGLFRLSAAVYEVTLDGQKLRCDAPGALAIPGYVDFDRVAE